MFATNTDFLCLRRSPLFEYLRWTPAAVGVFQRNSFYAYDASPCVGVAVQVLHGSGLWVDIFLYGCIATEQLCLHFPEHHVL